MEETELITRAVDGDLDAFNQLVLQHQEVAYNVAYRIMADENAAADATQDAVISMYRKLDTYRGGSFKSWFLRIVTNACYDELRRQRRRPTIPIEPETNEGELVESPEWLEDKSAGPEDVLGTSEIENAIQHCLSGLDQKFRIVITLVDVSGEDYEAVARIIGTPIGTVKSRLARARLKMQQCLQGFRELLPDQFRHITEEHDELAS
ncbi:MAG TPA: sigma-70 family RNA polymerase sigma factor [Anaerolineaceae bacterium]|nr:sigma-70 family RNA polymerase sigma factor [Anaerolineaceae bacterium]